VDEHLICIQKVVDSSSTFSTI